MLDKINETIEADMQEAAAKVLDQCYGGSFIEMAERGKELGTKLQMNVETRRIGVAVFVLSNHFSKFLADCECLKNVTKVS